MEFCAFCSPLDSKLWAQSSILIFGLSYPLHCQPDKWSSEVKFITDFVKSLVQLLYQKYAIP